MCSFGVVVERASIDEAYIDMTAVIDKMLSDSTGWLKVKFILMKFDSHSLCQCLTFYIATAIDLEELPNTYFVGWGNDTDDVKGRSLFYML